MLREGFISFEKSTLTALRLADAIPTALSACESDWLLQLTRGWLFRLTRGVVCQTH